MGAQRHDVRSHDVPWPKAGGYVNLVNLSGPYVLQPAAAKVGGSGSRACLYQMRDSLQYAATALQPAAARGGMQRQQWQSRWPTKCSGKRPAACSSSVRSLMQHQLPAQTACSNNCSGRFNADILQGKLQLAPGTPHASRGNLSSLLQHTAFVTAAVLSLHLITPVNFSSRGCVPTQIMSADANRGLILVTCTIRLVRRCNNID